MTWEVLAPWLFCLAALSLGLSEFYFAIQSINLKAPITIVSYVFDKLLPQIHQIFTDFSNGKFYRPWATEPILITPTRKTLTELSDTPVLSQRAVYADMFRFEDTMGIAAQEDQMKTTRTRSRLYARILSVRGPAQLAKLFPHLQNRVQRFLANELSPSRVDPDGSVCVPLAETCRIMSSRLMGMMFFGEKLTSDPAFAQAVNDHPQQTIKCMAWFQILPRFMSPLVHKIVTRSGAAFNLILDRVMPIIDSETKNWDEPAHMKELTLLHVLTEETRQSRDYWDPKTLTQSMLGLLLGASHQPWVNLHVFLYRLCQSLEWQDILREEIFAAQETGPLDYEKLSQLPLLDSFMRETARIVSLDRMNVRRKAMKDYTFSDGNLHIPAGETVCVSSYNASHNPDTYPDPETFDGRRFVDGNHKDTTKKYSDVSEQYLIWGYGSLACPGRFHASVILKSMLINMLLKYDIRLDDPSMKSVWMYEAFSMPYESTKVVLTPR